MAKKMSTSRAALDRFLNPYNDFCDTYNAHKSCECSGEKMSITTTINNILRKVIITGDY